MKDYRIPLSLAVPAVIGLCGVLWLLRRKSGSSDKKKKASKAVLEDEKYVTKWNDKARLEQQTLHVEKEGITISQRKIPENQARDRGSSDLEIDQMTGVSEVARNKVISSSFPLDIEPKQRLNVEQKQGEIHASVIEAGQDDGIASSQKVNVELLTTTVVDDLQEADVDQSIETSHSQPVSQISFNPGASDDNEEQSLDCKAVRNTLTCKVVSSKFKTTFEDSDQKLSSLEFRPVSPSSDKQTNYVENVQLNTYAEDSSSVIFSAALNPPDCDKTIQSFDNSSRTVSAVVLMVDDQEIDISLQQEMPVTPLKMASVSPSLDHSSFSDAQTHSQVCPSQHLEQVNHIEESCSNCTSIFTSDHSQVCPNQHLGLDQNVEGCNADTPKPVSELLHDKVVTVNISVSDKKTDTVTGNEKQTCDWKSYDSERAISPISPLMPITSSSSIDIVSPESVDSICNTESVQTDLNTPASLVNTFSIAEPFDANNSLSPIPLLCDVNIKQDASSHARVLFSESLSDAADTFRSENVSVVDSDTLALSSNGTKDESPAKSSSPASDSNSEGSNDSGRGGSEHDVAYQACETLVHFEFNMPSELCGRFIGRHGKNINYLMNKTGAHVSLTSNMYTPDYQICQVVGSQSEVDDALAMIRMKFPLQDYPLMTMTPIDMSPAPIVVQPDHQLIIPDVMQLSLPEGVSVDVFVSAIVDAGHLFVQQPTHRSFMSLEKLNYFLGLVYGQDPNVPSVPTPVESGIICVCENDGFWYRAMIMTPEDENGECQVKFVDYGGYALMTVSSLKQIRADFMSLPFQAVECFMANVTPNQNEQFFSEEATQALSDMTRDKLLQCQVVARVENGIPYIHLYQINTESNSAVMINRALVNSRLVRWIEIL